MDAGSLRENDKARILGPTSDDGTGDRGPSMAEFLHHFARTSGPPQIILLCLVIAMSLGSTIGIVPTVAEDRYARLNHGYTGEPCSEVPSGVRPRECTLGNEDALNSAALSQFVNNALTFATSSLMGSISDERGRKGIMLLGVGLNILAPLNLVLLQLFETMSPSWYYSIHALSGVISWIAISLSALSDVMPPMWRAPGFGMIMAGFMMGFALSPLLAVFFSHLGVCLFASAILIAGFIFACLSMPETLPPEAAQQARLKRLAEQPDLTTKLDTLKYYLLRPAKELMILNRNQLFRNLSALAFFSGAINAADHSLFLYFAKENFGFDDRDVATLFLIIGVMGFVVQLVILKPLNSLIGERRVIIVAFLVGALYNLLYGVVKKKVLIFIAAAIGALTGMSFPTISAIKSNNVDNSEQGRIQGALYSLSSLASALGPLMLKYIYNKTKDGGGLGKGSMFIFGSCLYLVATVFAWLLPEEQANSNLNRDAKKRSSLVVYQRKNSEYGSCGEKSFDDESFDEEG
jgi:DHA1 family tetracycline resistance protein-like MFS transporter